MIRKYNVSKPLKEDYIIRIKSRIEQRLDEPAAEEEKEEFNQKCKEIFKRLSEEAKNKL